MEEFQRVLLIEKYTELARIKSEEAQLTSKVMEGELAWLRAKGARKEGRKKGGKSGKSNEMKVELLSLKSNLEALSKRVNELEKMVILIINNLLIIVLFFVIND